MLVEVINLISLLVKWKFLLLFYKLVILNKVLWIFYEFYGYMIVQDIKDMNVIVGFYVLDELKKFLWYIVWVKSVIF